MAKTVFDVLKEKLDEEIESNTSFIANGSPKDYAGYRETVGLLRGLGHSRQIVEDLQRNYMREDEDD
jgi:hypothetical protein